MFKSKYFSIESADPHQGLDTCPPVLDGEMGICVHECNIDVDCLSPRMKCCKNACGGGLCLEGRTVKMFLKV